MSFGQDLLSSITKIIGDGRKTSGDNYIFHCPVCKHRKPKLEVHMITHKWHCWVCDRGGTGIAGLLKWIGCSQSVIESFSGYSKGKIQSAPKSGVTSAVKLPKEYIPLWEEKADSWFWRSAFNYAASRGMALSDILKYRIGYCIDGPYKNMIIIPNYDINWNLNYYVGRSFLETRENSFKLPNHSKDIIGFESYVDFSEPVIIVESVINAITLKRNAVPLYGKVMHSNLRMKILQEKPESLYIWLDPDADKMAFDIVDFFVNRGISVFWVRGDRGMDVNDYGYELAWDKLKGTLQTTYVDLVKYKLNK